MPRFRRRRRGRKRRRVEQAEGLRYVKKSSGPLRRVRRSPFQKLMFPVYKCMFSQADLVYDPPQIGIADNNQVPNTMRARGLCAWYAGSAWGIQPIELWQTLRAFFANIAAPTLTSAYSVDKRASQLRAQLLSIQSVYTIANSMFYPVEVDVWMCYPKSDIPTNVYTMSAMSTNMPLPPAFFVSTATPVYPALEFDFNRVSGLNPSLFETGVWQKYIQQEFTLNDLGQAYLTNNNVLVGHYDHMTPYDSPNWLKWFRVKKHHHCILGPGEVYKQVMNGYPMRDMSLEKMLGLFFDPSNTGNVETLCSYFRSMGPVFLMRVRGAAPGLTGGFYANGGQQPHLSVASDTAGTFEPQIAMADPTSGGGTYFPVTNRPPVQLAVEIFTVVRGTNQFQDQTERLAVVDNRQQFPSANVMVTNMQTQWSTLSRVLNLS